MTIPLTLTHLRFDCRAETPLKLGEHQAGERLRNALAQVMLRAVCPESPRGSIPTPEHAAVCPVCWLLAAESDPGAVSRAYALVPPIPPHDLLEPGRRFSFVLTLFGQGFQYLPYFVLAVPEVGRGGVGPGRGRFALDAIWSVNPYGGQAEAVLAPGENVVRIPKGGFGWIEAQAAAGRLGARMDGSHTLKIEFLTPTRLIEDKALVKSPDFGVFFRRLLDRISRISGQHTGQPGLSRERALPLLAQADSVRLVDADVRWIDFFGASGRTGKRTPMGGFTGWAVYRSRDWSNLLPWLVFGQGCQAGKLAVKGSGVYAIRNPQLPGYWETIMNQR